MVSKLHKIPFENFLLDLYTYHYIAIILKSKNVVIVVKFDVYI